VCEEVALLNNGIPTYGTIQERKACYDSNVEFKDPKGKSPVAYSRVMRKHKLTEDQVVEEAGKLNIVINPVHFTTVEGETKRGRPKAANKAPKEPKGAKGRPKKSKKVLEIDGGEDDLFATLMAEANTEPSSGSDDVSTIASEAEAEAEVEIAIKVKESKEPKKKAEKEAEKALKAQEKEAEKLKKEAEKEAEKAKKEAEKATKAAEKLAKETEKLAKAAEKEAEKVAKEAAKALKETEKKQKETAKSAPAAVVDNEPDVVKRFEFEGKKYLKSKKTGIIYNMEQDVIGKWNDVSNKIDFTSTDEEIEEEYEEEDEDEEE
jgi:flagellar biosynthesis GTPase FlhF